MFKRRISFVLIVAMILSSFVLVLGSCTKKDDDKPETPDDNGNKEETDKFVPDDLPADLNMEGYKYSILGRGGDWNNFMECEGNNAPEADVIHSAVYERNLRVQQRLNCKLEWVHTAPGMGDTKSELNQMLLQGAFYDFVVTTNNTILEQGQNSRLAELSDTAYLNLEKPWWWKDVMDELSYDGYSVNYLTGDFNIINITKMSALYFNFDLVSDYLQMEPEDFYKLVEDKKWTLEKFMTLTNQWFDTGKNPNGANIKDEDDILAFPNAGSESIYQFFYSTQAATQLYERLENGLVNFELDKNKVVFDTVEMLRKLFHDTKGIWNVTDKGAFDGKIVKGFASGNYIFLPQRISAILSSQMREMESGFGILPYPTLKEGEDYVSHIDLSSTVIFVPGVVATKEGALDRSSAVIEALASDSYRNIKELFYEIALKDRYTRDEGGRKMIDLIFSTAHKTFMAEFNGVAGFIMGNIRDAIRDNVSVTPKLEAANEAALTKINEFINKTRGEK